MSGLICIVAGRWRCVSTTSVIEPTLTVAGTLHATTPVMRGGGMSRQPNPVCLTLTRVLRSKAPVTHHTKPLPT